MHPLTRAALASLVLLVVAALLNLQPVNEMANTLIKRLLPRSASRSCLQRPFLATAASYLSEVTSSTSPPPVYTRTFNTTSPFSNPNSNSYTMANSTNFFDAIKARHSVYSLSDSSPISDARIQEIVQDTLLNVPSAFNSQTTRLVLVLKQEHKKLWQLVREVYRQQLPADKFEHANQRFVGFEAAYGTVSTSALVWLGCHTDLP